MFREHDRVIPTRDVPAYGLVAGAVGTVVGAYGDGGYEVEFTTADGSTLAVVTLGDPDEAEMQQISQLMKEPPEAITGEEYDQAE